MSDIAPVIAAVGGTAVGLAGIVATYRASKGQQVTALAVARIQAEHQASMAREERHQRRLEAAYRDLLEWITRCENLMDDVHSRLVGSDDPQRWSIVDDLPKVVVFDKPLATKRDNALWSDEVRELEPEFRRAAGTVWNTARKVRGYRQSRVHEEVSVEWLAASSALDKAIQDACLAAQAIRQQVRSELVVSSRRRIR